MKINLNDARLYGIIDLGYVEESDVTHVAEQMVEGCVDMIQLRGKGKSLGELAGYAARLHEITARDSTPLIVNDHAEIASQLPVEGAHVGQDDDSVEVARRKAVRAVLIGKSTHSIEQARLAVLFLVRVVELVNAIGEEEEHIVNSHGTAAGGINGVLEEAQGRSVTAVPG